MAADKLTVSEITTLGRLEKTIAAGIQTFVEVGLALMEIRDKRLYRDRHKTFEAYCQERWNLGRHQARNLIDAADVVSALTTNDLCDAPHKPESIRQARPLAKLPREERAAAWQEVVETAPAGKPTGKHAEKVVARRLAEKPPPSPPPSRRKVSADLQAHRERKAAEITQYIPSIGESIEALRQCIDRVRSEAAQTGPGAILKAKSVLATLNRAIEELKTLDKAWRN